ncbi:MAG: phosphoglycolate phosphatase [Proteobacteria bacterium]|nr:phosphoglycolate phosphatase [Pseudomonadota bacterium]MBI3499962.1 phosphoglycolate phosphatase [Pseudomonadota bacterium]
MPQLRAVVFDLDGTLVDSAPDLLAAANLLLESLGRRQLGLTEIKAMIGDGTTRLVERALAATGAVPADSKLHVERFLAAYEAEATRLTQPYPGVLPTLQHLAEDGIRLAVCTNKPLKATTAVLGGLGLDRFFSAVVGGDSLAVRKPDPRVLLEALARLETAPNQAVMVGDNEHDVATARAAGVPMILVSYGYARLPVAELGADRLLHRFDALPAALAEIAGGPPPRLDRRRRRPL